RHCGRWRGTTDFPRSSPEQPPTLLSLVVRYDRSASRLTTEGRHSPDSQLRTPATKSSIAVLSRRGFFERSPSARMSKGFAAFILGHLSAEKGSSSFGVRRCSPQ